MSEAIAFDTHRFVKNLTQNGFTEKQAEALATEQVQLLNSNLATKTDILALQARIETIQAELQARIETVQAELQARIETVQAELQARIETVHAELQTTQAKLQARIETVHAGLQADLQTAKADLLKWILTAIIAQGGLVVALIKLL